MRLAQVPLLFLFFSLPLWAAGSSESVTNHHVATSSDSPIAADYPVIDLRRIDSLDQIIPDLKGSRAIFVGESHANYAHHLLQFRVIEKLHNAGQNLAIGMEMFQQPMQAALDRYVAGETTEREMLEQTEWFDRWKYDYRLYRSVVNYAAKQGIPIVALNVPEELVARVSESGLGGLTETERAAIPNAIDFTNERYLDYLEAIFSMHGSSEKANLGRFVEVQLLWDEGMAEAAAKYLNDHPDTTLVVIAGSGHIQHGYGIPSRLKRRLDVKATTILPMEAFNFDSSIADFVIFSGNDRPPPAGLLGIYMTQAEGGVQIATLLEGGAADKNGLKERDLVTIIDQTEINSPADVKMVLLDKVPGDRVKLTLTRRGLLGFSRELTIELPLGGG